jgi:hypothetical protein
MVRGEAVKMISKYVKNNPALLDKYYEVILGRLSDEGVSVACSHVHLRLLEPDGACVRMVAVLRARCACATHRRRHPARRGGEGIPC